MRQKKLPPPTRLADAVNPVAIIGGYLARRKDPPPAALTIHRHAMLGILDTEGYPVEAMGVVEMVDNVVPLARSVGSREVVPGRRCEGCGNHAVIRKDGCNFCTACGAAGACG